MAKNDKTADETQAAEGATTEAAPKADKRRIILKNVTQADGSTKDEPRADYIRRRWADGNADRRTITNEVTALMRAGGQIGAEEEVPYQIIFQATKGIEGGPPQQEKVAAPAAEAEASAEG